MATTATGWSQEKPAALPEYSTQPQAQVPIQSPQSPGPYGQPAPQQQYFSQQPQPQLQHPHQAYQQPQVQQPQMQQQHPGQAYPPQQGQYPPQGLPQQQSFQGQIPGQRQYQNSTPLASLGRSPAPVDCPACGQRSMSKVTHLAGNYAHAWAAGLCCLTGFFCFLPYIMDGFKNVDHNCGQCGVLLATWHRSGSVEVHQHA